MDVTFNNNKHYITNNFEKLLREKDGSKNTSIIMTPILIKIGMHIGSTRFLDNSIPDIVFSPNRKI